MIKVNKILVWVILISQLVMLLGCVSEKSQLGVLIDGRMYEVDSGIGKVYVGEVVRVKVYGGGEGALIVGRVE